MSGALFWDFDGTLVHGGPQWSLYLRDALAAHGHRVALEDIRVHLSHGFTWHRPERTYPEETGRKWWDKLFAHYHGLYRSAGVPEGDWPRIDEAARRMQLDPRRYRLYGDAVETLERCAAMGYDQYILSNNFPELPDVVAGLGLAPYFRGVVVSALEGCEKPHPKLFAGALALAGRPETAYMIGDSVKADIAGGKAAGMGTILVHSGTDAAADHCCGDLAEIPALLEQAPVHAT